MTSYVRIAQVWRTFTAAILVYSLHIEMYGATGESCRVQPFELANVFVS